MHPLSALLTRVALILTCIVGAQNTIAETISAPQAHTFLTRTTFGPTPDSIEQLQALGYQGWLDAQLAMPVQQSLVNSTISLALMAEPNTQWFTEDGFIPPQNSPIWRYQNSAWWGLTLNGEDQLRQRVAFALSEIFVVSSSAVPYLRNRAESMAAWYDLLQNHAFGNFRELMSAVTYSPAMGIFLSYHGNRKANEKRGTSPDENYARELMQLFTLGLYRSDGTPTYTQQDVMELARVFTGWDMAGNERFGQRTQKQGNLLVPMEFDADHHDSGEKTLLGQTIPAGLSGKDDIEAALDIIYSQPEVATFISRLLIQRLVSSNPTDEYVARIAAVFNDNRTPEQQLTEYDPGERGDLAAVIRAIYTDPETINAMDNPDIHVMKIKEPILMLAQFLRAFEATPISQYISHAGGRVTGHYAFRQTDIGQVPLQAPSVFNYFDADYQPPGFAQNFVSPEAQLIDSAAVAGFSNTIQFILKTPSPEADKAWRYQAGANINLAKYEKLLSEVDTAVVAAQLTKLLIGTEVTSLTHQVQEILSTSNSAGRNSEHITSAVLLLVNSPEYWVQK